MSRPERLTPSSEGGGTEFRPARRRWAGLGALAVGSISDATEGGLVNTLFPVIRQSLGLGIEALGILTSINRFSRMIFGPLWSLASDRYGRKRVLVIVTGLWGLWTAAVGLAQNFQQLVILYSIAVIGSVAGEPITNGLLADLFGRNERGKAYGTIRSLGSLGSMVLTPLLARLAGVPDGWRYGMFIMGALSVLSGVLIWFLVDEPSRAQAADGQPTESFRWADAGTLFKTPSFVLMAGMLPLVTSLVFGAFFVTYFVEVRGWSTPNSALLYTAFSGGWAVSSLIGGFLGDLFERRMGPNGRVLLMQIYLLSFSALTFVFMQIDWGVGAALYVIAFLTGLVGSVGFSGCVLPMVSSIVPPALSATAFALLFSLIQGCFSAVLSLAMGNLAAAYGLQRMMFWLVTVPYAVNAVYWFLFYPFYPRDRAAMAGGATRP